MEERIIDTLIGVSIAVVGSAIIFIGANKWFDLTSTRWKWFGAVTGAVIAGVSSAILLGNRIIAWKTGPDADATDLSLLLVPLYMALAGVVGYLLNATDDRNRRLLIGGVGGLVVAGSLGTFVVPESFLAPSTLDVILWPIVFAALFVGIHKARNTDAEVEDLIPSLITGAGIGWLIGSWGLGTIGAGTRLEATLGFALAGLALGLRFGIIENLDRTRRDALQGNARGVIFLAPGLLFILMALIIPTIGTFILGFKDARAEEFIGFDNYIDIFTNPQIFNVDNISGIFTSRLTIFGVIALAIGYYVARRKGREVGAKYVWTGGLSLIHI